MPVVTVAAPSSSIAETPEEKQGWATLRKWLQGQGATFGYAFQLKCVIKELQLGPNNGPFTEEMEDKEKPGKKKAWPHFKAIVICVDEKVGGDGKAQGIRLPIKKIGYSWFDGKSSRGTTANVGGMYQLHTAIFHEPPTDGRERPNNPTAWPTEDYEGKPFLWNVEFNGLYKAGEQYYGTRANLNLAFGKMRPDPDSAPATRWGDDDAEEAPWGTDAVVTAPTMTIREKEAVPGKPAKPQGVWDDGDDF